MTTLLEIRDAHKEFGEHVLLNGATVAISDTHKVGLIGRNGAGKSTLCRIILGEEPLDTGQVNRHPRLRLGYLRQHDPFHPDETVLEFLIRDSGQPDWRCGEVAGQFELKGRLLEGAVTELSGGWQTRVKLASVLLHDPNLLVLDEPTNFLDLRTQLLLEDFLDRFRGAALVVSHDRQFLKSTCRQTLELARGELNMFPGDVDVYFEHRRQRRLHDERVNDTVRAKRKQLEEFIIKNRANPKTSTQARSKAKQLERLKLLDVDSDEATVRLRMPDVAPRQGTALRTEGLSIGYPNHLVAAGVDLEIQHGTRVAVVGDNGEGKTTLLRTLIGSLPPRAGTLRWGFGCQVGTYAQHVYTSLPDDRTVFDYLEHCATSDTKMQTVLDMAGAFLFHGTLVEKPIRVLSGGERARLCLAGLLLGGHNVLVMDEPANHLDVETVDALADALNRFQGTIIFTAHDRYFVRRVANRVVEIRDRRVIAYHDDYDHYVYRVTREIAEGQHAAEAKTKVTAGPLPREKDQQQRKARARRRHELGKAIRSLERQIAKHESRKAEFEAQRAVATTDVDLRRIDAAIGTLDARLGPVEQEWLALHEELDQLLQFHT
jgi:ATP-binding cassette subfamily F protein 3